MMPRIQTVKLQYEQSLLRKRNVVGVGIGKKIADGVRTDEIAVLVFVERKIELSKLNAYDIIPKQLLDFRTDVVETGKIKAFETHEWRARYRPAPGGVSIGHPSITAGTMGAVVRLRVGGRRVILSNNHVLADSNKARRGDPILQPGPYDGGKFPADHIANLMDFVQIHFEGEDQGGGFLRWLRALLCRYFNVFCEPPGEGRPNRVDAAIAEPLKDSDVLDEIKVIGKVAGAAEATLGMKVKKSGRTTEYTEGEILGLHTTVRVEYGVGQTARFEEQIVAGDMSAGGDSGSLVVDSGNRAVGLLFAGSDTHTILNRIEDVATAFGLSF